ncbi:MAG TPA: hypothetical protein VN026_06400 [Bacteroidia bacterium]|jgi:hypothetical protein|nr:hypothetical protein [Bacteroidia bacterium]
MDEQSITQGYTCEVNPLAWVKCENQLEPKINSYTPKTINASGGSKDKTILLAGLFIAIALFYITKKSTAGKTEEQTLELANANFEEEEKTELKKEIWNLMATQPVIKTETFRENIIVTKPESYSAHIYACSEGQLIIEQAYQNPNIGEKVIF